MSPLRAWPYRGPAPARYQEGGEIEATFGWASVGPGEEPESGVAALSAGRGLAMAAVFSLAVAMAAFPVLVVGAFQSLDLEHLISGVAGLAAVVGGVKFLAMVGGVAARLVASAPATSPGA